MKLPSLVAAIVISTFAPAFAITDADIAPAALVGKSLTFTIEYGGSPFATNGTWSGAFAGTGTGFTVTKITGDTVNISTTFSAALDGTYTNVTLGKFIEGQKPATLTLYTVSGVGHFEVSIQDLFGTNQNGTFTIGAPVVKKTPEINVSELGSQLIDGKSKVFIPVRKTGQVSNPVKLVIKNSGTARLTGLGVTLTGADRAKFKVSAPAKLSLAPGESTSLKVTYTATAKAAVSAALRISSNDKDENPFNLKLQGAVVRLIDTLP